MEFTRAEPGREMMSRSMIRNPIKSRVLRIVVDARQVYRPQRRGIGKTLINLYTTLAVLRPHWQFQLIHQFDTSVPQLETYRNLGRTRIDFYGLNRYDLWEQVVLPVAALAARADILHAPANTGPKRSAVPVVVNIHDLIPLEMAPDAEETRVWLSRVKLVSERSRHILTGSEYSKRKLMDVLGTPAEKITVNAWAPDKSVKRVEDPAIIGAVKARYGLRPEEPYLFAFGASDPRKNTAGLMRAYAALPESLRREFRLLIVGIQDESLPEFRMLAAELRSGDQVKLCGFTPEVDIAPLLSGAAILCFASKYEGFGLPVLDAFLCGTPLLAGNRTSLPEVGGDAAHYIDPYDLDSIRHGLQTMLTDEGYRKRLSLRGLERSRLFTWERTAETVAGVFEAALTDAGGVGSCASPC